LATDFFEGVSNHLVKVGFATVRGRSRVVQEKSRKLDTSNIVAIHRQG
jgi:hypothetical protein